MKFKYIKSSKYKIYENGTVESPFGRILSTWKETNTGYLLIRIRVNKKPKCLRLHRVLAEAFVPNPDNLPFVRHLNDTKTDNRLNNLAWGDNPTNVQEGYENACYSFPDKNSYAVEATCIKTGAVTYYKSIRSCAESLGLNRKNISAILRNIKTNTYEYTFRYL